MNDASTATEDLIDDLALMELYADNDPIAFEIDDWGNEWEDSNRSGTDYWVVED